MSKGHDEYLNNVNKVSSDSPNVLIVLMDDLGYGDTSYNARKAGMTPAYETPNIDSIAENGIDFDNLYSEECEFNDEDNSSQQKSSSLIFNFSILI